MSKQRTSSTMRAVWIDDFGGPDQLKIGQLNIPLPESGEVQIQIAFAGVNPVDWKIREGLLKNRMPYQFPLILGWDAAGIVSAVGQEVKNFKVGDAVFAYCRKPLIQWGTYAEYTCYPAEHVALKPINLSFAQAAAIPLIGLTAWQALFDMAKLKRGESILIHGGAGGVGSLAIQFAKLTGAHVLTTAGESHHPYVKELGADVAINYHTHSVPEQVRKIVPQGLDVVIDTIGGQTYIESFSLLKPGGRLVSLLESPNQALAKEFQVTPLYLFTSPNGEELRQIAELIQLGQVKPIRIEEMPLESAAKAQEKNRQGHVEGKIVLNIQIK